MLRPDGRQDGRTSFQIGNGARHLQDAVVGACREAEPLHAVCSRRRPARPDGHSGPAAGGHPGVAMDSRMGGKPLFLQLAGTDHALPDDGARFGRTGVGHLFEGERGDFHLHVHAVEKRPGDAAEIALHLSRCTHAGACRMIVIPARAGIHGGHQHEAGRIVNGVAGALTR